MAKWAESEASFRKLLLIAPQNPTVHHWYGDMLYESGRVSEAVREIRAARDLDPLSAIIQSEYANVLYLARKYDSAIAEGRRSVLLDTTLSTAYVNYAAAHIFVNQPDSTGRLLRYALRMDSTQRMALAYLPYALMASGKKDEARALVRGLVSEAEATGSGAFVAGAALLAIGDKNGAIRFFETAVRRGEEGQLLGAGMVDPLFDPLRSEPRFLALLDKLGIVRQTH